MLTPFVETIVSVYFSSVFSSSLSNIYTYFTEGRFVYPEDIVITNYLIDTNAQSITVNGYRRF